MLCVCAVLKVAGKNNRKIMSIKTVIYDKHVLKNIPPVFNYGIWIEVNQFLVIKFFSKCTQKWKGVMHFKTWLISMLKIRYWENGSKIGHVLWLFCFPNDHCLNCVIYLLMIIIIIIIVLVLKQRNIVVCSVQCTVQ